MGDRDEDVDDGDSDDSGERKDERHGYKRKRDE